MSVALVGCGRQAPAPLVEATTPQPLTSVQPQMAVEPVFEGRTAPQWAEQLHSGDATRLTQACQALRELKEPGVPHLLAGLRSRSTETRLVCLQALHPSVLTAHRQQTLPLVREMLHDASAAVRQGAATRLPWFGKDGQVAVLALRELAARDDSAEVRKAAAEAVAVIDIHVTGKVPDYFTGK